MAKAKKKAAPRKKIIPPAVTQVELDHLERMKRNLERLERESDDLRRRMRDG